MLWHWTTRRHAAHGGSGDVAVTAFLAHLEKVGLEGAGPELAAWHNATRTVDWAALGVLADGNPGIATRLLRLASTAPTGRVPPAHNIKEAFKRLGPGRVFETAAMTLTRKMFLEGEVAGGGEPGELWRHGVAAGILLRCLTDRMWGSSSLPPGEAFLLGLVHDLGLAAQCVVLGEEKWRSVLEAWRGGPATICVAESEQTGAAHPEIGARILQQWGIGPDVTDPVTLHHELPMEKDAHGDLTYLLRMADWVCGREGLGFADVGVSEGAAYRECQTFWELAPEEMRQAATDAATELAWLERLGFVSHLHLRLAFAAET